MHDGRHLVHEGHRLFNVVGVCVINFFTLATGSIRVPNSIQTTAHTCTNEYLGAEPPDQEVEVVDVAEADDRHHALAGEQGVEEGARLGEVQVLIWIDGCLDCACVFVNHSFIIKRACVMMSAPAIPKPTRSSPGVCG